MKYSLADFLRAELIPGIRRLTQAQDFEAIGIEFISVQELAGMDGFVREEELILSTADGCLYNEEAFVRLLDSVRRTRGSAILLAIRDEAYEVPARVIAYANAIGLPLFRIPWEHRFSDIQKAVADSIAQKKARIYLELRTALTNAFFESKRLEEAAECIEEALHSAVTIEDAGGGVLAAAGSVPTGAASDDPAPLLRLAIRAGETISGYLCLYGAGDAFFAAQDEAAREEMLSACACFPLSLWFLRKSIEEITALRLNNDFVWNLANGNYDSLAEMTRQGARLHFDLNRPYCCALMKAIPLGRVDAFEAYSAAVSAASTRIEEYLIREGKRFGRGAMVAGRSLDFILYLGLPAEDAAERIEAFIDRLCAGLTQTFPDYGFRFGLSEVGAGTPDFSGLYQNASAALQWCLNTNRTKYRFTYQDTREAQIVLALSGDEKIRRMAEEILAPLVQYDASSDICLLETLSVFIQSNYNTSLTARTLHLHRQSLLYRLRKIEDLTKMPLARHQNLFLFEICLRTLSRA